MGDIISMQKAAEAIADDAVGLSLSEALAKLHTHAAEAQRTRNGRELALFEREPEKIGRLVDHLVAGNYRDTAATLAGITSRSIRGWMEAGETGDPRYAAIAQVIKVAEALAEASAVRNVRAAGKDPRFWAAEMTYLERRHPERWGRRTDDSSVPKVIVQIGIKDSDVTIHTLSPVAPSPSSDSSGHPHR